MARKERLRVARKERLLMPQQAFRAILETALAVYSKVVSLLPESTGDKIKQEGRLRKFRWRPSL
ncbi:MAG: hypothetical protein HP046_08325 [Parabacteroides sp.]|nr:hypothetical protein [Parabacteroides sp.]